MKFPFGKECDPCPTYARTLLRGAERRLPEALALRRLAAALAAGAVAVMHPAAAAQDGLAPAEQALAVRLVEYEGLLGDPLPADVALCMDDVLGARWSLAAQPSPRQWQSMLAQARLAREQCARPPDQEIDRAAGTIRRAMAMQVSRQRAVQEQVARLRACAAPSASETPPAPCPALQDTGAPGQALWARLVRAFALGRR